MPNLFIVAGPNGAGKTTYVKRFLPQEMQCREFVNADLIAAGLSPFATIARLKEQGAFISVSHPFYELRKGGWQEHDLLDAARHPPLR